MNKTPLLGNRIDTIPQDTHREHLNITRDWLLLFGGVSACAIVFALLAGVTAAAGASLWLVLPLLTAFGFAALAAMIVLRSLEYARYTLQERFDQWTQNQETAREVMRITAGQITNVQVKGRSNVVSVNSGQVAESVRLVEYNHAPQRMIDGVPEQDLIYFCERVPMIGHSKRAWLGEQLPSGRTVNTFEIYDQMLAPLLKAGLIVGRGERSAGQLVTNDPNELKRTLGLTAGAMRDITPDGPDIPRAPGGDVGG